MSAAVLIIAGIGLVMSAYALYSVFFPSGIKLSGRASGAEVNKPLAGPDKLQKAQLEIMALGQELEKVKSERALLESELAEKKEKDSHLEEEFSRRQAWVAKSEELVNKVKEENLRLRTAFAEKEKELQAEFGKEVEFNKELRQLKEKLEELTKDNLDKTGQLEAAKYKIERYGQEIKTHLEVLAELKRKDKESEWVPKAEFAKLSQNYARLEKELETKEAKLKSPEKPPVLPVQPESKPGKTVEEKLFLAKEPLPPASPLPPALPPPKNSP